MQKEFNACSCETHTPRARPHYLRACRRRLRRFSPGEKDKTTVSGVHDGVYTLREQLYSRTYQRPLFMSSLQPSSTADLHRSSSSPFSRPSASASLSLSLSLSFSLCVLSNGNVLLRSVYINSRPKGRSMERRCWQVGLFTKWYGARDNAGI